MPQPDFSPAMLRGFLYARAIAREGFDGKNACRDLMAELMQQSGLPYSAVRAAFAGRLTDAVQRARLWAALGHHPCDHGIVLDDEGGQT